jgi:hypothetical protein
VTLAVAAGLGIGLTPLAEGTVRVTPARASVSRAWKMIWGPVTLRNGRSAFPIYHRLGVQVFEIDLSWADVAGQRPADPTNPDDPAYTWPSQLAQVMKEAARYHIRVCLQVKETPAWANGGKASDWAPTNASDYGNFLVAAAHEYPRVHLWMIWGEPTRPGNFSPMPPNSPEGPRRYALILNAGYHALKGVSKSNLVIGGNTWSLGLVPPPQFIRWMRLPDGKPAPLDYYGQNPFSDRFPRLTNTTNFPNLRDIDNIGTLEKQLRRTYHHTVKLFLSEYTISSSRTNRAFNFFVTRARQGRWVTAAFKVVDSVNYVAGLGWFDLADEPPWVPRGLTTGLLTWNYKPKPAFFAYQHVR